MKIEEGQTAQEGGADVVCANLMVAIGNIMQPPTDTDRDSVVCWNKAMTSYRDKAGMAAQTKHNAVMMRHPAFYDLKDLATALEIPTAIGWVLTTLERLSDDDMIGILYNGGKEDTIAQEIEQLKGEALLAMSADQMQIAKRRKSDIEFMRYFGLLLFDQGGVISKGRTAMALRGAEL